MKKKVLKNAEPLGRKEGSLVKRMHWKQKNNALYAPVILFPFQNDAKLGVEKRLKMLIEFNCFLCLVSEDI